MRLVKDGCRDMSVTRTRKYDWDTLVWREVKQGVFSSHANLFPAEYLHIDNSWEIDGPVRVSLKWDSSTKVTRIKYKSLRKRDFDMDNPQEYPCASCGADRKSPCTGDKFECTFRVFFLGGGKL
jgi:hypothetical protein